MNILIDTCLDDLYILLFKNNEVVDKTLVINLREKSEHLPQAFTTLLQRNNLGVKNVERFYVTKGPGSFMGIRAGLLFVQTLAGVLNKAVYACDTLRFLQVSTSKPVFIDARGGFFYTLRHHKPVLVKGQFVATPSNYAFVESHLQQVINKFELISPFGNYALYLKKPRIG